MYEAAALPTGRHRKNGAGCRTRTCEALSRTWFTARRNCRSANPAYESHAIGATRTRTPLLGTGISDRRVYRIPPRSREDGCATRTRTAISRATTGCPTRLNDRASAAPVLLANSGKHRNVDCERIELSTPCVQSTVAGLGTWQPVVFLNGQWRMVRMAGVDPATSCVSNKRSSN